MDELQSGGDAEQAAAVLAAELGRVAVDAESGHCVNFHEAALAKLRQIECPDDSELGPLTATGIGCIDSHYGGFRSGASIVLAARPGRGKSAMLKQIAGAMDLRGKSVLMVSLEMDPTEIASRILSERSGIDGKYLEVDESGTRLSDTELDRLRATVAASEGSRLYISAPSGRRATVEAICAHAKLMKAKHDIKFLGIDFYE